MGGKGVLGEGKYPGGLPTAAATAGSLWENGMGIFQGKRRKERSSGTVRTLRRLQGDGIQKKGKCNSIIPKGLGHSLCIHPIIPNTRIPSLFREGDLRCKLGERRNFASRAKGNVLGEEDFGMCWGQGDVSQQWERGEGGSQRLKEGMEQQPAGPEGPEFLCTSTRSLVEKGSAGMAVEPGGSWIQHLLPGRMDKVLE